MGDWRQKKRLSGRVVHETMCVPAVYVAKTGATPVRVNVRDHTKPATVTPDMQGSVSVMDTTPRIVFDRIEVPKPLERAMVAISESEIYTVGFLRPASAGSEFVTAEVARLPTRDATTAWDDEWEALLA